jgi:hypothetical protein
MPSSTSTTSLYSTPFPFENSDILNQHRAKPERDDKKGSSGGLKSKDQALIRTSYPSADRHQSHDKTLMNHPQAGRLANCEKHRQ